MYSILRLACFVSVTAIMLSCSVTKTVRTKPQSVSKKEAPVEKKAVKTPTVKSVKLTQEQKVKAYLDRFGPIARAEMRQYKIPASITLAQGILESGTGEGTLAKVGNNHFGIKCHRGWNGGRMYHDDDAKGECFRTYEDPAESYRDHSVFLSGRQRYAFLFKFHKRDYKAWARGLKKAGYATDPKYPKKLISIIQRYELYQYDTKKGVKIQSGKEYQKPIVRNVQGKIHSVEVGDTLYSIARQYSVSVDEIKKHNKLNDNTIFKGQELIIPKKK
ncbi:glucosaminidase domain-containing protein [Flavobacteriaceae bacterium]|nr:glucosaminidase domain-containing protein [Flavobacteriaceae bacterium]